MTDLPAHQQPRRHWSELTNYFHNLASPGDVSLIVDNARGRSFDTKYSSLYCSSERQERCSSTTRMHQSSSSSMDEHHEDHHRSLVRYTTSPSYHASVLRKSLVHSEASCVVPTSNPSTARTTRTNNQRGGVVLSPPRRRRHRPLQLDESKALRTNSDSRWYAESSTHMQQQQQPQQQQSSQDEDHRDPIAVVVGQPQQPAHCHPAAASADMKPILPKRRCSPPPPPLSPPSVSLLIAMNMQSRRKNALFETTKKSLPNNLAAHINSTIVPLVESSCSTEMTNSTKHLTPNECNAKAA